MLGKEGKRLEVAMSSSPRRPCGTLFPWRGPDSSGGDDFRTGDSLLASPGDRHWLVVHSSHVSFSPGDVRTRACDPLSPAYSPGEPQAQRVPSIYWAPLCDPDLSSPTLPVPEMESPRPRDGLLLIFSLGLSSSSAFPPSPSSPDLALSLGPAFLADRASVLDTGH